MMLAGIAGVAICYLTSYAVANGTEPNKDKKVLSASDLTLHEQFTVLDLLMTEKGEHNPKTAITEKLGSDASALNAALDAIHQKIKKGCGLFQQQIDDGTLDVTTIPQTKMIGVINALVNAMADKFAKMSTIASVIPDDHLLLTNWLVETGIGKNNDEFKKPITTRDLENCYKPLMEGKPFGLLKEKLGEYLKQHADEIQVNIFDDDAATGEGKQEGPRRELSTIGVWERPENETQSGVTDSTVTESEDAGSSTAAEPATETTPSAPAQAPVNNVTQAPEQKAETTQSGFNALAIGAMSFMLLSVF